MRSQVGEESRSGRRGVVRSEEEVAGELNMRWRNGAFPSRPHRASVTSLVRARPLSSLGAHLAFRHQTQTTRWESGGAVGKVSSTCPLAGGSQWPW